MLSEFHVSSEVLSFNQRATFAYEFSVEELYSTGESSLTTPRGYRSNISIVLRTPTIYESSPFISARVWLGGSNFGRFASSAISLVLSREDTSTTQTISCGSTTNYAGKTCSGELDSHWFDGSLVNPTVHAVYTNAQSVSEAISFTVVPHRSYSAPSDNHMWLDVPVFPVMSGADFEITLHANTSTRGAPYALGMWLCEIDPHESLSLESITSDYYDVTYTESEVISFAATFKSSFEDETEALEGQDFVAATLTFSVDSQTPTSTLSDAFALWIDDMVSVSNSKMIDDETGFVLSESGFGETGDLAVEQEFVVGFQAYVGSSYEQELLNTALLDGNVVASTITKKDVMSCHTVGSTSCSESSATVTAQSDVTCKTAEDGVLTLSGSCNVQLTGDESRGGDQVAVVLSSAGYDSTVLFRVWFPTSVELVVWDGTLNAISSSCASPHFQRSKFEVRGSWTCEESTTPQVDLTSFTSVSSDNEAIVRVEEGEVIGVGAGTATLSTQNGVSHDVQVSSDLVSAASMYTSVINTVDLVADYNQGGFDMVGLSRLSAIASHSLTAEGDIAHVIAYVQFDDGNIMGIGNASNLSHWNTDYLSPVDGDSRALKVVDGAFSAQSQDLLEVSWVVCDEVLISSQPWVNISLASIVDVYVTANSRTLVPPGDPLSMPPLNFSTQSNLTVGVVFDDGSTRDFTLDERISFLASSPDVVIDGNTVSVVENASISEFQVEVSFGSFTSRTASISFAVDALDHLGLFAEAYPMCDNTNCSHKVTISQYQTSFGSFYQQLRLYAVAESIRGDSLLVALSDHANVTLENTQIVAATSTCSEQTDFTCVITDGSLEYGSVVGVSPGTTAVSIDWAGSTASLALTVAGTAIATSIEVRVHDNVYGHYYVHGKLESDQGLILTTYFSDGTALPAIASDNVTYEGLPPFSSYLNFSSTDNSVLNVSEEGIIKMLGNSFGNSSVAVDVVSRFNGSVEASIDLYSNIEPECFDVDLGNTEGAPFGVSLNADGTFSVPVRINVCDEVLTAFQIQIFFDDDVIAAVNGAERESEEWPYSITYTYGSPSSMVQLISSELDSEATGLITLTTLTFRAESQSYSSVGGIVVETLGASGSVLGSSSRPLIAGLGEVDLSTRRRLADSSVTLTARSTFSQYVSESSLARRQLGECGDVSCGCNGEMKRGDINGDCKFSVGDLDFLKRYLTSDTSLIWHHGALQMREMDQDFNGDVDGVDTLYILYALAKKYRFLDFNSTTIELSDSCSLVVNVTLLDDDSMVVDDSNLTAVTVDAAGITTVGSNAVGYERHEQGHLIFDASLQESTFSLMVPNITANASLDIAFMIETREDTGRTSSQRQFPFYGSTYGEYGDSFTFVPFTTVSVPLQCRSTIKLSTAGSSTTTTTTTTTATTTTSWRGHAARACRARKE